MSYLVSVLILSVIFATTQGKSLTQEKIDAWTCARHGCLGDAYAMGNGRTKRTADEGDMVSEHDKMEEWKHMTNHLCKNDQVIGCLKGCVKEDPNEFIKNLVDSLTSFESLVCKNLNETIKTFECLSNSKKVEGCITKSCENRLQVLHEKFVESIGKGKPVYPGKERCEFDSCLEGCVDKNLNTCGPKNFKQIYQTIRNVTFHVSVVILTKNEPSRDDPKDMCFDIPVSD